MNVRRSSSSHSSVAKKILRGTPSFEGGLRTVNPSTALAVFDFTLLGSRVATVVVSPYIPKATVDESTVYDHSSICATIKEMFGFGEFLTHRDAQANTFTRLANLNAPRNDAPMTLPRIAGAEAMVAQNGPATELHTSLTVMAESLVDRREQTRPRRKRSKNPDSGFAQQWISTASEEDLLCVRPQAIASCDRMS